MSGAERDELVAAWERLRAATDERFHDLSERRAAAQPGSPLAKELDARLEAVTALIDLLESAVDVAIRRANA